MLPNLESHSQSQKTSSIDAKPMTKSRRQIHMTGAVRLSIQSQGERIDRIHDMAAKKLSKDELQILDDSMLSANVLKSSDLKGFKETLQTSFESNLKTFHIDKERKKFLIKILLPSLIEKAGSYEIKSLSQEPKLHRRTPSSKAIHRTNIKNLQERFSKSERIPQYIQEFDVKAPHTIPIDEYTDVRIARKINNAATFVNKQGNNTEVFLGSQEEAKQYYSSLGYTAAPVKLGTRSSTQFYYFENPKDTNDAKMVIMGVGSASRLNNVLLQLKFLGIDLSKVQIKGTLEDYLKNTITQLDNRLSSFDPPPKTAYIGNRTMIVIELAKRLYPEAFQDEPPSNHEKIAESLLKDHELTTIDIGGVFKFSYMKVAVNGEEQGILAMRMPNGDLAYHATHSLLSHGVENLLMVGAGGALGSGADIGSYQQVTSSTYNENEVVLPQENIMNVPLEFQNKEGCRNVTVDSPLVENKNWMDSMHDGQIESVDVETYHIFRAIEESENKTLQVLPGLFTSDIVGEHPLTEKIDPSNAYKYMSQFLNSTFDTIGVSEPAPVMPVA